MRNRKVDLSGAGHLSPNIKRVQTAMHKPLFRVYLLRVLKYFLINVRNMYA